MKKSHWDW